MSPRPAIDHIRKPQILRAAAEVITERGLAATRIADVAERAGTSAPAVLYWFESRDHLLTEALTADELTFGEELEQLLEPLTSARARMLATLEKTVSDGDLSLWIELWARSLHDPQSRSERRRLDVAWRERIAAIVREGQEQGDFDRDLDADGLRDRVRRADRRPERAGDARRSRHERRADARPRRRVRRPQARDGAARRARGGRVSSFDLGARLTRRQALRAGAGGALGAYGLGALAGCTVSRPIDKPEGGVTVSPKIDGDLLIYNWAQYMDPALKKEFGEKYGVEVNEVNFDNLEAMVTKLRAGGRYDLIWPTPEYAVRLENEGLLAHYDRSELENAKGISPFYDTTWWDPDSQFSVPYTYYTTGIAWREDEVQGMTGSWNDLTNPDGEGRMFILDDYQEAHRGGQPDQRVRPQHDRPERARDLEGDAARAEGVRARHLDELDAEPRQRHGRDPPGLERRHRQRPQPGRQPRGLPLRDLQGGRARRHRPDVHPGDRPLPGDGAEVHRLDHPSPTTPPGTSTGTATRSPSTAAARRSRSSSRREPSIDVDLEQLGEGGLEYRLDNADDRALWTQVWTEVKAS